MKGLLIRVDDNIKLYMYLTEISLLDQKICKTGSCYIKFSVCLHYTQAATAEGSR